MDSINLKNIPCFGIAGNFTGHLEQAGEAVDFRNIRTAEANAPKALFPTYIPGAKKNVPSFLGEFPFDAEKIVYPKGEEKIQIEPECAVIFECEKTEADGKIKISKLNAKYFMASNDCSIRKEGVPKISVKKNWGKCSKGYSEKLIEMDSFTESGKINSYRIASFLVRGGEVFDYGEDSAVKDYSYVYGKLEDWILDKLNDQKDEGPAENVNEYLSSCASFDFIAVSIGATRYTEYGRINFLLENDDAVVVLYPENRYSVEEIKQMVAEKKSVPDDVSLLRQTIVLV